MIKTGCDSNEIIYIPLLPVSAQAGTLNDFVVSVKDSDCEKIISPIKGADFAITVSGDSMAPEYPSGSKILIKKINERSFIEWGRCYVLDTCNGTVIKKLMAPEKEDEDFGLDYVTCVSVNPNPIYKAFNVSTKDIYGIYRVLMLLTEK
jgi:phage repressor protein C with HTH and peptisase S24 domain